ncbi:MAG: hypothetical protein ACLP1Q_07200, partial [Solirubrobacteraceae bacterium]
MLNQFKRISYLATVLVLCVAASSALGAQHAHPAGADAGQRDTHHRRAGARSGHKPGAVVHRGGSRSVAGATDVLLGDTAVEWQYDSLPAGQAEAFRLPADASGVASAVHVYVSAGNAAGELLVGIYSAAAGHPGTLLSTGSAATTEPDTWTSVSIAVVELARDRDYWLAILGKGGRLRYRDRASGPCPSDTSAERSLSALPGTWRTGTTYSDCPVSAYVTAASVAPSADSAALPSALDEQPALIQQVSPEDEPKTPASATAPDDTALPTISGNASEGQTVVASTGSWSGSPTSYAYQWQECNSSGGGCSNVSGATANSYQLAAGDVGHTMRVVVTASNAAGSTPASSAATATVVAPAAPKNTELPRISGSAVEGDTLSTSNGAWTGNPTSFKDQWQ